MGIPDISPKLNPHSKPKKYTQNKKNKFLTTPQVPPTFQVLTRLQCLTIILCNLRNPQQ
ncbi:unnamed protein product [Prunus brigantina]